MTCSITESVSATKTPPMMKSTISCRDDHRDGAERGAERQCADVAHEHFGRVRVEPEEAEPGADHGAAEHRELARAGDVGEQQVLRVDRVAGHVHEDPERAADHDRRQDRQAVETVGQVDRVRRADDHEVGQDDEAEDAQRVGDVLEERDDQVGLRREVHQDPLVTHCVNRLHACPALDAGTANASDTAAASPISDCQKYFSRADSPFGLRCTTLR